MEGKTKDNGQENKEPEKRGPGRPSLKEIEQRKKENDAKKTKSNNMKLELIFTAQMDGTKINSNWFYESIDKESVLEYLETLKNAIQKL